MLTCAQRSRRALSAVSGLTTEPPRACTSRLAGGVGCDNTAAYHTCGREVWQERRERRVAERRPDVARTLRTSVWHIAQDHHAPPALTHVALRAARSTRCTSTSFTRQTRRSGRCCACSQRWTWQRSTESCWSTVRAQKRAQHNEPSLSTLPLTCEGNRLSPVPYRYHPDAQQPCVRLGHTPAWCARLITGVTGVVRWLSGGCLRKRHYGCVAGRELCGAP